MMMLWHSQKIRVVAGVSLVDEEGLDRAGEVWCDTEQVIKMIQCLLGDVNPPVNINIICHNPLTVQSRLSH